MASEFRIVLSILVLLLAMVSNCQGGALIKENLDQQTNVLKIAFGLNLDLNTLNETTFKNVVTIPDARANDFYSTRALESTSCAELSGLHCIDCLSYKLCGNEEAPVYTQTCPSNMPYCESGTCVEKPTTTECLTAVPSQPFKCSAIGYIPDPVDCQKYYFCARDATTLQFTQTVYQCPSGFAFNSASNNCRRTLARCRTFTCGDNRIATYIPNKAYYGVCRGDVPTENMVVFKCPDTVNMAYNPKTFGCEYQCRREGYFPSTVDESTYYFCYRDGRFFKSRIESCPSGYLFKSGTCQLKSGLEMKMDQILALLEELKAIIPDINPGPGEVPAGLTEEQKTLSAKVDECLPAGMTRMEANDLMKTGDMGVLNTILTCLPAGTTLDQLQDLAALL